MADLLKQTAPEGAKRHRIDGAGPVGETIQRISNAERMGGGGGNRTGDIPWAGRVDFPDSPDIIPLALL